MDEDGVLKATVAYLKGGITFKNAYKDPDPTGPSTADTSMILPRAMTMPAVLAVSCKRRGAKR